MKTKALLLVGSPKGKKSTSHALGRFLLHKLETGGLAVEEVTIGAAMRSVEDRRLLLEAVDKAGIFIVSFPLYVDQLPAPLIEAFELIAARRTESGANTPTDPAAAGARPAKIVAIVQCGFPESHQNRQAVDIMRRFAAEAGFHWGGALSMGMGGAVAGRPLEDAGGMVRKAVEALELTAASLLRGEDVPRRATAVMAKALIPKWLYILFGDRGMKKAAKKRGVRKRMRDRPYAPAQTAASSDASQK